LCHQICEARAAAISHWWGWLRLGAADPDPVCQPETGGF
jgi:hypothetical protein